MPSRHPDDANRGALVALDRVAAIGDEEERRQTGAGLLADLAATRAEQGRPFA